MLWEASVIASYRLAGLDGEIASVRDFYFDDRSWVIRYLIADTGNWLTGIHISIARAALIEVDGGERHIPVDMTKEQIERSPVLSSQAPVSEQLGAVSFGIYGSPEMGPNKPVRGPAVRGMREHPPAQHPPRAWVSGPGRRWRYWRRLRLHHRRRHLGAPLPGHRHPELVGGETRAHFPPMDRAGQLEQVERPRQPFACSNRAVTRRPRWVAAHPGIRDETA